MIKVQKHLADTKTILIKKGEDMIDIECQDGAM
jgi:hypothetical protein